MKEKEEEAGPHGKRAKSAEEALAGLMRYAARAERSSGDALRLMRRWNVPEADRERILHQLCESGFIDDRRFAAAYVREKSSLAGWACTRYGLAQCQGNTVRPCRRGRCAEYETGAVPTDCRAARPETSERVGHGI